MFFISSHRNTKDPMTSLYSGNVTFDQVNDTILESREIAETSCSYREVAKRCKSLVVSKLGRDYNNEDYEVLLGFVLDRTAGSITHSSETGSELEGAGSKDFFMVWAFVEKAAYLR
jgi:hypothetical protein